MPTQSPLKVFISYASADRAQAKSLYEKLVALGTDPWIDTEDLLPGQDWKLSISRALDETDVVLLCLSKNSVSKEGYVQKEMRLALDRALEIPPGEIFLIPCRFEDCEPPYSLRDFHYVDLFSEEGMPKLVKSLALRAEKVQAAPIFGAGKPAAGRKKRSVSPAKDEKESSSSKVEVHIHGNVTGSNIVLGSNNIVRKDGDE